MTYGLGFQIEFKIFKVAHIHINSIMFTDGLRQWSLFHPIAIGNYKAKIAPVSVVF